MKKRECKSRVVNCSCGISLSLKGIKRHLLIKHNIQEENYEKNYIDIVFNHIDIEELIGLYNDGNCVDFLMKKYDLKSHDIKLILKVNNVKKRTNSESKKTKTYIDKYTNTIQEKYGVDNVSKLESVKEKKVEKMLKNFNRINNFCDDEIRNKAHKNIDFERGWLVLKKTLIDKYGVDCLTKIPGVKEKIGLTHKKNFAFLYTEEKKAQIRAHISKIRNLVKYKRISKLEVRIQELLNTFNYNYQCNTNILGYNFDLLFNNKHILEINGDYWHANPSLYKESDIISYPNKRLLTAKFIWDRDKKKKELVEKEGYKVFYLWETDINKMCDIEIINFLIEKIGISYETN